MSTQHILLTDYWTLYHNEPERLKEAFHKLLFTLPNWSPSREYPPDTPYGFYFQHYRPSIIALLAQFSPHDIRPYLMTQNYYDVEWLKFIFNHLLIRLEARDIALWFFFQFPYYIDDFAYTNIILANYLAILNYAIQYYPEKLYFNTETEFIQASKGSCLPYAASYTGLNCREILTTYTKLLRKICPWLNYYNHQGLTHTYTQTYKIIFVSDTLDSFTSVFRDRSAIIGKLFSSQSQQAKIYFASWTSPDKLQYATIKQYYSKFIDAKQFIQLTYDLTTCRQLLHDADIIIYTDLGMRVYPTLLAYSRLAPIQAVSWGHSCTSGIDTIDYFIGSQYFKMNPEHYSELVIAMNSLSTYYISPTKLLNYDMITRQNCLDTLKTKLGLPLQATIYGCLQSFYKINSQFENIIKNILISDPNSIIVFSSSFPWCSSHLKRLALLLDNNQILLQRIKWFGPLDKHTYLDVISCCRIHLEPFPFGGCNTSFDAFAFNIPVISLDIPDAQLCGSFTTGLYRAMSLTDCIANSHDEYIQLAIKIANNDLLYNKICRKINDGKHKILCDQTSIDDWKFMLDEFLTHLDHQ